MNDSVMQDMRSMHVETISVVRARRLVETQPPSMQRSVNPSYVKAYARMMQNGGWIDDLPTNVMVISASGELIEGQHRCRAAIMANRSFGAWISYNHPTELIRHLGQSNPRTLNATLKMSGGQDVAVTAAAAKLFFNWLCGENPFAPVMITVADIEEVDRELPQFREWVQTGKRMWHVRSFNSAAPTPAVLIYLIGRTEKMSLVAPEFWRQVETGTNASEAALLLRNMWLNDRGARRSLASKIWRHNTCVRAWAWFRSGEAKSKMAVPRDTLLEWR